jgi:hypothetical protein
VIDASKLQPGWTTGTRATGLRYWAHKDGRIFYGEDPPAEAYGSVNPIIQRPEVVAAEEAILTKEVLPTIAEGIENPIQVVLDAPEYFTKVAMSPAHEASLVADAVNVQAQGIKVDFLAAQVKSGVSSSAGGIAGPAIVGILQALIGLNWGKVFIYIDNRAWGWLPVDIARDWRKKTLRPEWRRRVRMRMEGQGNGGRRYQGSGNTRKSTSGWNPSRILEGGVDNDFWGTASDLLESFWPWDDNSDDLIQLW